MAVQWSYDGGTTWTGEDGFTAFGGIQHLANGNERTVNNPSWTGLNGPTHVKGRITVINGPLVTSGSVTVS